MVDKYYVYKHTFSNGTVYFGKGSNDRILSNKRNRYWTALFNKYGTPVREFLHTGISENLAFTLEQAYIMYSISTFTPICNISTGGEASASGYHHTSEAKQKISQKLKGRVLSAATRDKMSKVRTGRVRISSANKNTDNDAILCNRKEVVQMDKEFNVINVYPSITAATNITGINSGSISTVCQGKAKTAGKFYWAYLNK